MIAANAPRSNASVATHTCISVPAEHAEALQQLLWWLWLIALNLARTEQERHTYSTDGLARIASINLTGGTTLTQGFGFDSIGNLSSRSLSAPSVSRSETETFSYDALDQAG